jgi:diguanylate cyclase (GGDEF)-like protein
MSGAGMSDSLKKWLKYAVFALAVAIVVVTGLIEYRQPYMLGVAIVYLLPVVMAAWVTGRAAGIAVTGLSGVAWLLAEISNRDPEIHIFFPIWNSVVLIIIFLIVTFSLSALKQALERERVQSRKDFLTGVGNRKAFYERAEMEMDRCRRYGRPFTIAYMDCDNFKVVNDKLGHHVGDDLLRAIAGTIRQNIRDTDSVARLGGDEFAILLPELGGDAAREFCGRIRQVLLDEMGRQGNGVTFSLGAATYNVPPESVDEIAGKADRLMYSAKNGGKNSLRHEVVDQEGREDAQAQRTEPARRTPEQQGR